MDEESNTNNKKDLEDKLGKELDSKKYLLENKEKEINLFSNSFNEKSGSYIEDIRESEEESEKQALEANRIISSTKSKIDVFVSHFTEESQRFKRNIWTLFGIFLALFFIPYFTFPILKDISHITLPIEPALLSTIITIVGFAILIYKASRTIDSKLFSPSDENSLRKFQDDSSSITQNKIEFPSKKEKFNQKLQEISEGIRRIVSVSEEYIPGLKEYYSGMALKTKQEHFAFTLRNALRNYSLLDYSIEKKLARYSNLTQTEEDWLEDASYQISEIRGISKEIIKLAYYDYVGSKSGINNVWSSITTNGQLAELINVLKNNLTLENRSNLPDQPFIEIIRDAGPFSIENFMRLYNEFYNNLEKERMTVLRVLEDLRLPIDSERRKLINGFFPITTKTEEWTKQLVDNASTVLEQKKSVVWLFYLDKVGLVDTRDTHWQKEKMEPGFIDKVSDFMIGSLDYPSEFQGEDVKKLCTEIISGENTFDVAKITKEFFKRITATKRAKSLIVHSLEAKKIPIPQKIRENQFERMIAFGDNPETELAENIASLLGIRKEIVILFYLDYLQSPRERREIFDKIRDSGNMSDLASLLLTGGTVRGEKQDDEEVKMLSDVLKSLPDFDVDNLRSSYSFYRKISHDVTSFTCLLDEQKIKNIGEVKFEKIVEILQNIKTSSRFEALEKISQQMVNRNQWKELDQEEFEALTSSTLVIYLIRYFDRAREDACIRASTNDLAVKVLYEWIDRKNEEKQFGKQKSTLDEVAYSVFDGIITKFEHLNDFKRSLEEGRLFGSTDELIGARFADLKKEIISLKNERSLKLLDRAKEQITKIMDVRIITNDFIRQILKSQVISAYMITYKDGPVIKVISKYLKDSCEFLSESDDRFSNLIIMNTDESLAGKGTRIGVVPLRIKDFEEFSKLFHQAFKIAVDRLKKDDTDYQGKTFSANLIRIIPSDLTFKPIQIGPEDSEPKVLESITRLVRTELSPLDRIQIAASARENEPPTVALREVVASLFNQNARLGSLIYDDIKDIVDSNPKLRNIFEGEKFDSEIRNRYDVSSNTDLAIRLFKTNKQNPTGTRIQFLDEIRSILNSHKIELDEISLAKIGNVLLESLIDIAGLF